MAKLKKQYHTYIILILLFLTIKVRSQESYKYNLNDNNGLPSNHIYSIMKDRNGYLWFATPKGIARYNGYEFKTFGMVDGLPKEDVWQLLEDKKRPHLAG
jgi:ligand-binding sensor domain-containing protein